MNKNPFVVGVVAPALALLLLSVACGDDQLTSLDPEGAMEVLAQAGKVSPQGEEGDSVTTEEEVAGDFLYVTEYHDVLENKEGISYLGLNDDIVWPGNLVRGDRAHEFVYEPIIVDRQPVTISISSLGTSGEAPTVSRSVDNPRLSTMRQGIADLLAQAITPGTTVPARAEASLRQVYNESHLSMFVGADVSYELGELNTRFDWSSTTKQNKIVAKYKQIYYSIDIDQPASPLDFFDSSMTVDELRSAVPPGSMPIYVAGVDYGMMALMFIESDYSEETMGATLQAKYDGVLSVEVEAGVTAAQVLQNSSMEIVVYGGATAGLGHIDLGGNIDQFMEIVEESQNFGPTTPGVPLVYKFRHVLDNTLALVTMTSQYSLVIPIRILQQVRLTVDSLVCTMSDDEASGNNVDMDRFGIWLNAYNKQSASDPGVRVNDMTGDRNGAAHSCGDGWYDGSRVWCWWTPGEWTVPVGGSRTLAEMGGIQFGGSLDFTIRTGDDPSTPDVVETYDFGLTRLVLQGWGQENDPIGYDQGYSSYEMLGDQFRDNGGVHKFNLTDHEDFAFDVFFTIELLN
jgi:hypothetical protein